jgi:hypothetical protein
VGLMEGPAPGVSGGWQAAALRCGRGAERLPVGCPAATVPVMNFCLFLKLTQTCNGLNHIFLR